MNPYDALEVLADFCNTRDQRMRYENDPGLDHLLTREQLQQWLHQHELLAEAAQVGDEELHLARELRRGLRMAIDPRADRQAEAAASLNEVASRCPIGIYFDPAVQGSLHAAGTDARRAIGKLLLLVLQVQQAGYWDRLKMCAAADCLWVFIDRSRPGSGKWCSMQACGNRAKKRTFRQRQKAGKEEIPE